MPIISLSGLKFHSNHGFYPEEQLTGGEFEIDLYIDFPWNAKIAEGDELGETINYEVLYLFCQSEMKKTSKLIETVAFNIMERIKEHYGEKKVNGIRVHLKKLNPPLSGRVGFASVEIGHGSLQMSPLQLAITTTNTINILKKV